MNSGDDLGDLFEEAPIPYLHETLESRFIRANRAARSLLGISPHEVEHMYGKSLIADTPESQERLQAALEQIKRGGEPVTLVLELHRKDNGRSVWVEWISNPAPNGLYTRTMLVDITQRVLIEQTKTALEFSLESGQVGEWDLDLLHDTSRRSLRHDQCFGYSERVPDHEWGAVAFIHHVHPEDRQRVENVMRQAVEELREWSAEFRVTWPDGSQHWLVAKGNIYRTTDEGHAARMLGIVMDITERKRTEEALAASEQLARGQVDALARTIEALAMESDPDRLLVHVLHTIIETLGARSSSVWRVDEADEWVSLESAYEDGCFLSGDAGSREGAGLDWPLQQSDAWSRVFQTREPTLIACCGELHDEDFRERLARMGIVTMLMVPMVLAGRVAGALGIQFTSARVFRDQEIELAKALVNQAMFAMQLTKLSRQSREAAIVAERNRMARDIHDTLAQGLTGVIVQLEAAADAQARGLVTEADSHISRASGLAREGLTEARRSVRALRPKELEVGSLSHALDALLQRMTRGTPLTAQFSVEGTPTAMLPVCEDNVLRAVMEVLTNALRHANATTFKANITYSPSTIHLTLHDDGCGFDAAGKYDGFGLLGVRERVESMHGRMTLESRAGRGTHYSIALPTHPPRSVTK